MKALVIFLVFGLSFVRGNPDYYYPEISFDDQQQLDEFVKEFQKLDYGDYASLLQDNPNWEQLRYELDGLPLEYKDWVKDIADHVQDYYVDESQDGLPVEDYQLLDPDQSDEAYKILAETLEESDQAIEQYSDEAKQQLIASEQESADILAAEKDDQYDDDMIKAQILPENLQESDDVSILLVMGSDRAASDTKDPENPKLVALIFSVNDQQEYGQVDLEYNNIENLNDPLFSVGVQVDPQLEPEFAVDPIPWKSDDELADAMEDEQLDAKDALILDIYDGLMRNASEGDADLNDRGQVFFMKLNTRVKFLEVIFYLATFGLAIFGGYGLTALICHLIRIVRKPREDEESFDYRRLPGGEPQVPNAALTAVISRLPLKVTTIRGETPYKTLHEEV